jgi:hypothetical protein
VSTTSPQSYVERMSEFFEIDQPDLYGVIEEYAKLTGVPVILNTSWEWLEIEGGVISSLMQQAIPAEAGGDYAMTSHGTIPGQPHLETETAVPLFAQALRPCCVAPGAHARCAAAAVATL